MTPNQSKQRATINSHGQKEKTGLNRACIKNEPREHVTERVLDARPRPDRGPTTLDKAIAQTRPDHVRVSPAKALELASHLFGCAQYAKAERVCRQIIEARPSNAHARNLLGVSLNALGRASEGIEELKAAIRLAPGTSSYHANLGELLRQAGDLDEASSSLEKAIQIDPGNADALNNLGIVSYERKEFEAAIDYYRQALALRPDMAEAHNNLGNALRLLGDSDGALQAYHHSLTQRAHYPEAYHNLGTLLQQDGKLDEAEHAMRKAILQNPRYVDAHNSLAQLLFEKKQELDALRILGDALKFAPTNVQTLLLTARIQMHRNNFQAAEQAARLALQQEAGNAEALMMLGQVLHETDRFDEAIEVLETAISQHPANPDALNSYGVALKSVGRLDEARGRILEALELNGTVYGAYANLNDLINFSEGVGEDLFNRMEAILETASDQQAEPYLPLHFAYAKALDDRGLHEKALEHYIVGGRIKRKQLDYRECDTFAFFDAIRATFPKELFESRTYHGVDDDRPVFIIGMPRSGSTLVEQILSSHPDVHGAGEVKYLSHALSQLRDRLPSLPKFPQMIGKLTPTQLDIVTNNYRQALLAGAAGARKITDKLLTNYYFAGLIHLMFPRAKIIHTLRDPIDTCLSTFTKLFKDDMPHSYDLAELGRYYGKYRELMEHWATVLPGDVLTSVRYEDVVADTKKEARRLLEFLELQWSDRCLEFHKSDRPVKTASVAQVRRPIYKTSVRRWEKYGTGLQPLIDAIGSPPATM